MSALETTGAALRAWGADLDPNDVSDLLGIQPTRSENQGDILSGKNSPKVRIAKMVGGGYKHLAALMAT